MRTSLNDIKIRALAFSKRWADASDEAAQAKPFWLDFFEIFGITDKRVATFEHHVKKLGGRPGFIDLFWPGKLLVEHKSLGKDLDGAIDQGLSYLANLKEHELPQLLVACDFARFRVRIMATGQTVDFDTRHLHKHIMLFGALAGYTLQTIRPENPVNIKAAERMGQLHDALKASGYGQAQDGHALEVLLVRVLFCLFADDTGIFQPAQSFRDFIAERTQPDGSDLGARLGQLFQVLNTPEGQRSPKLDEALAAFPYINGGLFQEALPLADFDAPMRETLLQASGLDWSQISPAIFGSLFQSIMDEKARRNLGAHYTSEANILKLIGPLFLDELHAELARVQKNRSKLQDFHHKLQQLTFFDPACGCGNFLVICYRELRELELQVLRASHDLSDHKGQRALDVESLVRVNVHQFYGIEIEEFPSQIAQVALWLVDHQMNQRVGEEFGQSFARIPLVSSPHIVHGNALTLDWNDVLPAAQCSYVLGNPPFLGKQYQSAAQKQDLERVTHGIKGAGVLDFVCGWYIKAAHYVQHAHTQNEPAPDCAFVSTNSITQGEQVPVLWAEMQRLGMQIHFAHRTFQWSNEASGKAAVHCVIVGFGLPNSKPKTIYEYDDIKGEPHVVRAGQINAYLVDGVTIILESRSRPICAVPEIQYGSMINDGGHLLLTEQEFEQLKIVEPETAKKFVRRYLGAEDLINDLTRYCLWLKAATPSEIRSSKFITERVAKVKATRSASKNTDAQKAANTPTLFFSERQPNGTYIAIPRTSSERRSFIPTAFLSPDIIANTDVFVIPNAGLYHFGVLTSTMHNAWMRFTCGRLKSDYRYSASIVYNNFPWPDATGQALSDAPHQAIEKAAQAVLDARAQFAGASLADLYDPLSMPPALLKAHQKLDAAVDKAYESSGGKKDWKNDAERVAFLFGLYEQATSLLATEKPSAKTRKKKDA